MLDGYRQHIRERLAQRLPPLPLNAEATASLIEHLKTPPAGEEQFLLDLLAQHIDPYADAPSQLKASFLTDVALGHCNCPLVSPTLAIKLLGTMPHAGTSALITLLEHGAVPMAADPLKYSLDAPEQLQRIADLAQHGNAAAHDVLEAWTGETWRACLAPVPPRIPIEIFSVPDEAWHTAPSCLCQDASMTDDIPGHVKSWLHALDLYERLTTLRQRGNTLAYAGSTPTSMRVMPEALTALQWCVGQDQPFVPLHRRGGIFIAQGISSTFSIALRDIGMLPVALDASALCSGGTIDLYLHEGKVTRQAQPQSLATFGPVSPNLLEEFAAGGRPRLAMNKALSGLAQRLLAQ